VLGNVVLCGPWLCKCGWHRSLHVPTLLSCYVAPRLVHPHCPTGWSLEPKSLICLGPLMLWRVSWGSSVSLSIELRPQVCYFLLVGLGRHSPLLVSKSPVSVPLLLGRPGLIDPPLFGRPNIIDPSLFGRSGIIDPQLRGRLGVIDPQLRGRSGVIGRLLFNQSQLFL